MYCYQGKEHFCSILFTSQNPENVKTTLVQYLLRDPENCELSCCFFICSHSLPPTQWWTNVNFRGTGGGGEGGRVQVGKAQVTHLFISWSDTILREISTFSSAFPKGDPAKQPDRHQPVRCKLGHPGVSLSSTYKWNGKPEQQACFLLTCALLVVKAGSKTKVYSQAWFSHCMCWRPFPLFRVVPQRVPMPICVLEYLQRHQSPPI